jgi:transposase
MDAPRFYVGIDVASETLTVVLTAGPGQPVAGPRTVANTPDGFADLAAWLVEHEAAPDQALVCLESTGVYGEAVCYGLHGRAYAVAVEDAAKVKRAMPVAGPKTDALDARRIADYAARFLDVLRPWTPAEAVVEQVQTLLTMREQLMRERGAKQNALHVLRRKHHPTPLAIRIAEDAVGYLGARVKEIDAEVRRLVSGHPTLGPAVTLLLSVPGVGYLLAAHLCVATGGFSRPLVARQLSAWLGVCPLEYESGSSVRRRPRSRGYGPSAMRKLLYLASMRLVSVEGSAWQAYFRRKVAEGKSGRLVLNNVGNKLLRVAAAVLRDGVPYEAGHVSVRPSI